MGGVRGRDFDLSYFIVKIFLKFDFKEENYDIDICRISNNPGKNVKKRKKTKKSKIRIHEDFSNMESF